MLKEKTTELLPSDPIELEKALTAAGLAPEVVKRVIEMKAALESVPKWQRTTSMGHA